jgi:hypothetical protein
MPRPNKSKKQLAAVQDGIGKRRKTSKLWEERLNVPKEDSSPIEAIAEAATSNKALPDVVTSLPPADFDVNDDANAHSNSNTDSVTDSKSKNRPRAVDPSKPTSTSTSSQGVKLEPAIKTETELIPDTAPANPSTDQAEASIPTETVIKQLAAIHDGIGKRRKTSKLLEERLNVPKEDSSPIEAIAEAATTNTAVPDVLTSLPPADFDVNDDANANANSNTHSVTDTQSNYHPRAADPSTSSSTSSQGIKLESIIKTETTPAPDTAPANPTDPATEQAEASIPTETVSNGPNLNRTFTVRRKAAKRTYPLYIAPPPPPPTIAVPPSPTPETEEIPVTQEPHVEEPPPTITVTDEAARGFASPEISAGLLTSATPLTSAATVNIPTETREAQLEGSDEFDADDVHGDLPRASWEYRLSELADYRRIHGHCSVPERYSEYPKLGTWVVTQKKNYRLYRQGKASPITALRIHALESVGFEWGSRSAAWEDRLSELADFRRIHGHCNVPRFYSGNTKLGNWVNKQRCNYKLYLEGKTSPMSIYRLQALKKLGFE